MPDFKALIEQNKKQLAVGGVVVVAALGLSRRKKAATGGPAGQPTAPSSAGSLAAYGGTMAGGANNSSSDVYNSLAPLFQTLQQRLDQAAVDKQIPVAQYAEGSFIRPAGGSTVYQVTRNGLDWITPEEGGALGLQAQGGPIKPIDVSRDASVWATKVVGQDSPLASKWWPTGRPTA